MRILALWMGLVAPTAAEWSVRTSSTALLATETTVTVAGAAEGLRADEGGSTTAELVVVRAEERDGAWTWTLLPLSTGTLTFTPRYWSSGGKAFEAPAARMRVSEPALPSGAEILDIRPPLKARPALWPWLLGLALAAAAWKARQRWLRRVRPGLETPVAPPAPPEVAARLAIAELQATGLWPAHPVTYYLRLTEIMRSYLEARYGEPATAMTSAETARLVKARAEDLRVSATVRELLLRADLVKFARVPPAPDEGPRDAGLALAVINATTPAELAIEERA